MIWCLSSSTAFQVDDYSRRIQQQQQQTIWQRPQQQQQQRRHVKALRVQQGNQQQEQPQQQQQQQKQDDLELMDSSVTPVKVPHVEFGDVVSRYKFGDVVPTKNRERKSQEEEEEDGSIDNDQEMAMELPLFSKSRGTTTTTTTTTTTAPTITTTAPELLLLQESKRRNWMVAILSITLAISSYLYDFTHPIEPVQLLYTMQQTSQPISIVGENHKPTVVDFWAPVRVVVVVCEEKCVLFLK